MMNSRIIEIVVGMFVAIGLGAFFFLAMYVSSSSAGSSSGYTVSARFENIGSLKTRSPVTMSGVLVGRVDTVSYDMERYEAVVTMTIQEDFNAIPTDTTASVYTAGLLGEQYVALEPGGEEEYLKEGDEISLTQSALVLEKVIGQVLFSKAEEGAEDNTDADEGF